MRILRHSDDEGWTLDGAAVSVADLARLTEPVYGMDLVEALAEAGPEIADVLESGLIIDLDVASRMYNGSTGNEAPLGELEDLEWLAHRVPRDALLSMTRGMVALRAAHMRGVPISERNCRAAVDNLLKAGGVLAEQIEDVAPAIWETREGEIQTNSRGMPMLSDNVTRWACREAILRHHHIEVNTTGSISELHKAYPDVPFLEMVVRYKRIQRDLQRLLRVLKSGDSRMYFGLCGIDSNGLSIFRTPNIAERAVRGAVQSSTDMVQIDMGDLDLQIAKRIARRNNSPIWDDVTTCAQLGRLANPTTKSAKTLERLGREIVRASVVNDSVMAAAHRYYGGKVGPDRVANMRRMLLRVVPAGRDPWETEIVSRVRRNLLAEDSLVLGGMDMGIVSAVLSRGNERFSPQTPEQLDRIWDCLAAECRDPELRARLSLRKPSNELHFDVFCDRGVTWNYRVLHCCTRAQAGLWGVYGTMHDVMREVFWLVWRNGGYPITYHSNQLLVENIDTSACKRIAAAAQQRILGAVWCEPEAKIVRRWRL